MRESGTDAEILAECREILARNSRSFALAARCLPRHARDRAAAVYAYCRHVDDAIDGAPPHRQGHALSELREELRRIYAGEPMHAPALRAFQAVVRSTSMPYRYPRELIEGMAMDVARTRYEELEELLLYCHRVAGVVGLMMCHVFEITRDDALERAAHLGIGMQLTNICRDVLEDWGLGRLYLPRALLREAGAPEVPDPQTGPFPDDERSQHAMRCVIKTLLREADRYYDSAEAGIPALPFAAGLAVRAARMLYRAIGVQVIAQHCDPLRGRAVVSSMRKFGLMCQALGRHVMGLGAFLKERWVYRLRPRLPRTELTFPADLLPADDRVETH